MTWIRSQCCSTTLLRHAWEALCDHLGTEVHLPTYSWRLLSLGVERRWTLGFPMSPPVPHPSMLHYWQESQSRGCRWQAPSLSVSWRHANKQLTLGSGRLDRGGHLREMWLWDEPGRLNSIHLPTHIFDLAGFPVYTSSDVGSGLSKFY